VRLLTLIYYFFRSVFLRGLFNTIKIIAAEGKYERFFKISTAAFKHSYSKENFHYQGASYLVLFRIFKVLKEIAPHSAFVDIGCGKGRVIFVAEHQGYNTLIGIELDKDLVDVAQQNLIDYPFKRTESEIKFTNINALDFNYENKHTIYFLFNPFNETVLTKVLSRIIEKSHSETIIVYMNPIYQNAFKNESFQVLQKINTRFYTEAIIYRKR